MILNKEDFINRVKERIGEDMTDDDISFLEDMTDTFEDLEERADTENWREKYDELDRTWRQKYIDRFNGKVESDDDFVEDQPGEDEIEYEKPKTYEDLFRVGEE